MSAEVAGQPEGVSLIEAIDTEAVETPGELSFPQWQKWRRGPGMRPTVKRDGRGLSTKEEVDLWRSVMEHLYGAGRAAELEEDEEEPEERLPGALVPSPLSPGSGSPSPSVRSGGRAGSPRPSSAGSGGASVSSLQAKLRALYDPSAEDLGPYLMRMGRTIEALTTLEAACPPGALEKCTRKAELMIELYAEHGGLNKPLAVRFLRDKFLAYAQDDSLSPEEKDLSILCIGDVIEQLGGKPSSSADKLFSTPSDSRNSGGLPAGGPVVPGRGVVPKEPARQELQTTTEEDRLRAKLAAAELELEGLRQERIGSEAGSVQNQGLVAVLEEQTKVLREALGRGQTNSITTVKADLQWPTLGDDRSDVKDVNQFYEEFEDVCALANSCRGMGFREMLVALRGRCRGSRLQAACRRIGMSTRSLGAQGKF